MVVTRREEVRRAVSGGNGVGGGISHDTYFEDGHTIKKKTKKNKVVISKCEHKANALFCGSGVPPNKKWMTTVSIIGSWGSSIHNCLYTVLGERGATVYRKV